MSLFPTQKDLIAAWMRLAELPETDPYLRFMALWVAFNAYCYAHYYHEAVRPRADMRKNSKLIELSNVQQPVEGTIRRGENGITIELNSPGKIKITITERYTEDHIFSAFAKNHTEMYKRLLEEDYVFSNHVRNLKQALKRPNGTCYVINMAKSALRNLNNAGVCSVHEQDVVPFDNNDLETLKNVLYQIRCNVFHGGKVPGERSDDLIVQMATPVLQSLLQALIPH